MTSGISRIARRPRTSLAWLLALALVAVTNGPAEAYEKRLICGEALGTMYVDSKGNTFEADDVYTVGNGAGFDAGWPLLFPTWKPVGGTLDEPLYLNQRNDWDDYRFDVPNGDYVVRLHFADILKGGEGIHVADIDIEGVRVLDDFDAAAEVGSEHYALTAAFGVTVNDGQLLIEATAVVGVPYVSAIEVQSWPADVIAPATPTDLMAFDSYNEISMHWAPVVEDDLAGYHVERADNQAGPYTRLTTTPVRVARYFDESVAPLATHYYRVVAVDVWGNESAPSTEASATEKDNSASTLPVYEIELDPNDLRALYDDPHSDVYQIGTFRHEGQVWNDVGIRFRGRIARNLPKRSWKVKFDEFVPSQLFYDDQEELNLNSHHGERTQLREASAYHLHRETDSPASHSDMAHLQVNGKFLGVFTQTEQLDERWLDERGFPGGGNLYKSQEDGCLQLMPDSLAYTEAYGKKTNRSEGYDDLIAFIELINATPSDQLYHTLAPIFDIEGFFNYYATQVALASDSFFCHNYYLYHDLTDDFWYYLPWDLDSTFGHLEVYTEGVVHVVSLLRGQDENDLITKLHEIPHFRNRYLDRVQEIVEEHMTSPLMDPVIDDFHARMIEDSRVDWYKWGWEDNTYVNDGNTTIKSFIPLRTNYINSVVDFFKQPQDLFINEIMANNDNVVQDEMGEYDDWFEIVNMSTEPVSMAGMFVTDDITQPMKFAVPDTTIPPGGFIVFWADEQLGQGPTHVNFKLETKGEFLGLFGPVATGNQPIDTKSWGNQLKDVSYGRTPDGGYDWDLMATPTAGAPNTTAGNLPPFVSDPQIDPQGANLDEPVVVTCKIEDVDGTVVAGRIYADTGSGFQPIPMADDGLSGDGAAGDDIWGGTIPGQSMPMIVRYYVEGEDDMGKTSTDPTDAPFEWQSYAVAFDAPPLYINEFMADNVNTIEDEHGFHEDWVEIYNAGPDTVQMAGLTLSDNFNDRNKYVFPEYALGPDEFLLVWCDNDPLEGPFHANFRLSSGGEEIGIFGNAVSGYSVIDTLTFTAQMPDTSFGRDPDGGPVWKFYPNPTPGLPNNGAIGIADAAPAPPRVVQLGPLYPNPHRPRIGLMRVPFALPADGRVTVDVYDVAGRNVRALADARFEAGWHVLDWDARNDDGARVASGIYFVRLEAAGQVQRSKLVLIR